MLNDKEARTLADYIEKNSNDDTPTTFLVEVIPQSMSTDVKISIVDDPYNYIKIIETTSVIDWENYNW